MSSENEDTACWPFYYIMLYSLVKAKDPSIQRTYKSGI